MNTARRKASRWLLWLTTVVALFILLAGLVAAAEYGARYFFRDVTITGVGYSYFDNVNHEKYWKHLNHLGYRERNFQYDKPSSTYRIAVVGDSFTWGHGVGTSYRFSDIIECLLNDRAPPGKGYFQVLNFGYPTRGYDEETVVLEDQVSRIGADFVLVQWFLNDIDDGHTTYFPPARDTWWTRLDRHLMNSYALYFLLKIRFGSLKTGMPGKGSYFEYLVHRYGDESGKDWQRSRANLRKLMRALKQVSADRAAVVMFPHLISRSETSAGLNMLMDRVRTEIAAMGVPVIDLREIYDLGRDAGNSYWVNRFDTHPSEEAHAMAAFRLYRELAPGWIHSADTAIAGAAGAGPVKRTHCEWDFINRHDPGRQRP